MHVHDVGSASRRHVGRRALQPDIRSHGIRSANGTHAGDLPNVVVPGERRHCASRCSPATCSWGRDRHHLRPRRLGLMLPLRRDDYASDPGGNAGTRYACGVIVRPTRPRASGLDATLRRARGGPVRARRAHRPPHGPRHRTCPTPGRSTGEGRDRAGPPGGPMRADAPPGPSGSHTLTTAAHRGPRRHVPERRTDGTRHGIAHDRGGRASGPALSRGRTQRGESAAGLRGPARRQFGGTAPQVNDITTATRSAAPARAGPDGRRPPRGSRSAQGRGAGTARTAVRGDARRARRGGPQRHRRGALLSLAAGGALAWWGPQAPRRRASARASSADARRARRERAVQRVRGARRVERRREQRAHHAAARRRRARGREPRRRIERALHDQRPHAARSCTPTGASSRTCRASSGTSRA
jgi:hypothetical protein